MAQDKKMAKSRLTEINLPLATTQEDVRSAINLRPYSPQLYPSIGVFLSESILREKSQGITKALQ